MSVVVIAGMAGVAVIGATLYYRLSSSRRLDDFADRIDAFTHGDLSGLIREFRTEFAAKLNVSLDLADLDGSAWKLDEVLRSSRIMLFMAAPDRPLRMAELAGAAVGELVRRHGGGEWLLGERSPGVRVPRPDGDREILPFVDALNQFRAGRPGDLHALILFTLGRETARLRPGHWAEKRIPIE